ncbi:pentapeptide repeat-containing protein, partial [Rhodococcus sp. EPR-134]|uniref:pentapeptide repeat-containing protein n=1 Tax=Rhodococcus sp. EPR-134 TaxID=1813675 RepID=UPI000A769548
MKPRRSDGSDETIPPAPRVRWLDKKDGRRLIVFTSLGIGLTAGLVFAVMTIFVRLIGGEGSWWRIWTHELGDGQWFEASRVTVALVALTVAGGAAYLAYRRQHTADQNQTTAAETQRITAQAYALSIRQHDATLRRERRDRFTDAAAQLAHTSAAVRIAGVYAMAALADDWQAANDPAEVQTCVDVLCGYLRLPYDPEVTENHQTRTTVTTHQFGPGGRTVSGQVEKHFEYRQNDREVRATILRVIKNHLELSAAVSWGDRAFDFHGAVLEDLDMSGVIFRGPVSFEGAHFTGNETSFHWAEFNGNYTSFGKAEFTGNYTSFEGAHFTGNETSFQGAHFTGNETSFDWAEFTKSTSFYETEFTGNETSFHRVEFTGTHTSFHKAKFTGARTSFSKAQFTGARTSFDEAEFTGN